MFWVASLAYTQYGCTKRWTVPKLQKQLLNGGPTCFTLAGAVRILGDRPEEVLREVHEGLLPRQDRRLLLQRVRLDELQWADASFKVRPAHNMIN